MYKHGSINHVAVFFCYCKCNNSNLKTLYNTCTEQIWYYMLGCCYESCRHYIAKKQTFVHMFRVLCFCGWKQPVSHQTHLQKHPRVFFILCFLFCLFVCLFCFSAHFESNYLWHLFFYHHSNCDFVSFYKKNLRKLKKKHDVKRSLGWFCNRNKVGFSDFYLCGDLWICVEIWRYPL